MRKQKQHIINIRLKPGKEVEIETDFDNKVDLIECLAGLIQILSQQMVEEARIHVGDKPEDIEQWIDKTRQNSKFN